MVLPAPLGFASVYCAHDSSFCRFSSPRRSPNAVPSISESSCSCSDVVSCASDCGLQKPCQTQDAWGKVGDVPAAGDDVAPLLLDLEVLVDGHRRQSVVGLEHLRLQSRTV